MPKGALLLVSQKVLRRNWILHAASRVRLNSSPSTCFCCTSTVMLVLYLMTSTSLPDRIGLMVWCISYLFVGFFYVNLEDLDTIFVIICASNIFISIFFHKKTHRCWIFGCMYSFIPVCTQRSWQPILLGKNYSKILNTLIAVKETIFTHPWAARERDQKVIKQFTFELRAFIMSVLKPHKWTANSHA